MDEQTFIFGENIKQLLKIANHSKNQCLMEVKL